MTRRSRIATSVIFACVFVALALAAPAPELKTPAEMAGYSKYTQHEEVARFLTDLAKASPSVKLQVVGKTLGSKELPAVDLRLCILSEEGADSPARLNRKRTTYLVVASQHGNEQSGKEAALQLIRDLAIGNLKPLLKKINVLVMPQANPYGNFVNRRQNEQNLDLNRDHVKLEAPETRAIHSVIRTWMPEASLDIHEKGDDYYRVNTGCVSNLNISERLQKYSRERLFPAIAKKVEADGFTWHEYLVSDTVGGTGAAGAPEPESGGETLLRYSTTDLNDGRNGPGIYETLSFIQEGASRHDIPTLEARTRWQYSGIRALTEYVADHATEIRSMVLQQRTELLYNAKKGAAGNRVHMRMQYVRDPAEPEITLQRFEGAGRKAAPVENPKVVTETVKNWYPKVQSGLTVSRTAGYFLPAAQKEVVDNLLSHGIKVGVIAKETQLQVETYRVREIVPSKEDYVAPEKIEVALEKTKITAHKGDFFVSCVQPGANLIPSLLEPQSEYGLIRYHAFKLVPAAGETFAISRVPKAPRLQLTAP